MHRAARATLAVLTTLAAASSALSLGSGSTAEAIAAAAPRHQLSVTGAGVTTYPSFSAHTERYGITTTSQTAGTVTVTASTSDPAGRIRVNGRVLVGGSRTLSGLTPGDEIAVFFEDTSGLSRHSLIYLPAGFPVLERVTPDVSPGTLEDGHVLLTLSQYVRPTPPALDFFETAVDQNGVPAFARRTGLSMDLNRQPDGRLSVFRANPSGGGEDLVLLDEAFQPVGARRAVGLTNTDGHDAIVLPDGTTWFMSYEPRNADGTGPVDAVVQRVDPDGSVGFQWSSAVTQSDAVRAVPDYAHVNSFQVMADGDLLVSFRHFSSVFKIATTTRGDIEAGDVVWKLGGRDSDFDFAPGDVGPCAQHTARELPDGNVLLFDNGSWNVTGAWCVDPEDRDGPPVQRVQTRVVEYQLDEAAGTARVVSSYAPPGRFAVFAGSSQRLANGNTLIGWAEETQALVSEIDPSGDLLWELRDPSPTFPYFSYRAAKTVIEDVTPPVVDVAVPLDGATYVQGADVVTDVGCVDRGGSSLQVCDGPVRLDTTSPGQHTATFTARDGAGRTTTLSRSYTVQAATGVDAAVRLKRQSTWVGEGTVGSATTQLAATRTKRAKAVATVRIVNTGALASTFTVALDTRGRGFRLQPGQGLTTPELGPGQSWELVLRAKRKPKAPISARLVVTVTVTSLRSPAAADRVTWRVKGPRR